MPMMLFWLPTIFIGAFFELARIACESSERSLALSGGAMLPGGGNPSEGADEANIAALARDAFA